MTCLVSGFISTVVKGGAEQSAKTHLKKTHFKATVITQCATLLSDFSFIFVVHGKHGIKNYLKITHRNKNMINNVVTSLKKEKPQ